MQLTTENPFFKKTRENEKNDGTMKRCFFRKESVFVGIDMVFREKSEKERRAFDR